MTRSVHSTEMKSYPIFIFYCLLRDLIGNLTMQTSKLIGLKRFSALLMTSVLDKLVLYSFLIFHDQSARVS